MRTLFVYLFFVVGTTTVSAQTERVVERSATPIGGVQRLALIYYRIDFSRAQRDYLTETELEFIYAVDTSGRATLEEINGTSDPVILDSLYAQSVHLPRFEPGLRDGVPTASLFFLKLTFPNYRPVGIGYPEERVFRAARPEDFEYLRKGGRFDVLFGGAYNRFAGQPADFLKGGGGMNLELTYTGKKGTGGGLIMNFYQNGLTRPYPVESPNPALSAPTTLLIGAGVSRWWIPEGRKSSLGVQLDLAYALQNITETVDEEWVQLSGFSPGLTANYALQLGKDKTHTYYNAPAVYAHHMNLRFGVRPVLLNLREATGVLFEAGVGYRLAWYTVEAYQINERGVRYQ